MRVSQTKKRRGVAMIFVIVVLVVISTLMATVTAQTIGIRRLLSRREQQQQSLWLARSGLELALAHLLTDPKYKGGTTELIPLGQVRVAVQPVPTSADMLEVTSEARFPTDVPDPVMRSVTERYRRVVEGNGIKLEHVLMAP
jgi:type II secretory pathway component PulK